MPPPETRPAIRSVVDPAPFIAARRACRWGLGGSPLRSWLAAGALLLATGLSPWTFAATSVHKCVFDGRTTYQIDPCPSGVDRKAPTVEQLNAERRKRLQQSAGAVAPAAPPARGGPLVIPPATSPAPSPFACDGRIYCSQMRSCAEATFFLARCPGTRMDGDHDGIPCEEQWCR